MEDAFANDHEQNSGCTRRTNQKWIFCRYREDKNFPVKSLDTCLCTHLIYDVQHLVKDTENLKAIRNLDPDLQTIVSIPVSSAQLQNSSQIYQDVEKLITDHQLDGVDVRIQFFPGTVQHQIFLNFLQDLKNRLGRTPTIRKRILALTLEENGYFHVAENILRDISNHVDVFSRLPDISLRSEARLNESQVMEVVLKLGIQHKFLIGVSLPSLFQNFLKTPTPFLSYPEVCLFLSQKSSSNSHNISAWKDQHIILQQSVRDLEIYFRQGAAGTDIWYINDDDKDSTCGEGPFPLLHQILETVAENRKPFGSFRDLDIVLSTGESQISEEIQILHESNTDPEEMKKFKCERIGFFRHPKDCTKFYQCAEYRPSKWQPSNQNAVFIYKCPQGLVFDEIQESCIWPSYSDPCPGSDELLPVPPKKFLCSTPGFHVDPADCRWFYYCSDLGDGRLEAFQFQCPSHLLGFDERNLLCNWKWTLPICSVKTDGKSRQINDWSSSAVLNISDSNKDAELMKTDRIPKTSKHTDKIFNLTSTVSINFPKQGQRYQANATTAQTGSTDEAAITAVTLFENTFLQASKLTERQNVSYATKTQARSLGKHNNVEFDLNLDTPIVNTSHLMSQNFNETENRPERKYGTAYWHRSWVNNKVINNQPQRNVVNSLLDTTRNHRTHNVNSFLIERKEHYNPDENNLFESEPEYLPLTTGNEINNQNRIRTPQTGAITNTANNTYNMQLQNKSGIGRVRKLRIDKNFNILLDEEQNPPTNLRQLHRNSFSTTSASLDEYLEYQTQSSKDDQKPVSPLNQDKKSHDDTKFQTNRQNSGHPFTPIKCTKLRHDETYLDGSHNNLDCVSEVSLFVQVRENKNSDRYILKKEQITSSAHQESKQIPISTQAAEENIKRLEKLIADPEVSPRPVYNESKQMNNNRYTWGRSLASNNSTHISGESHIISNPSNTFYETNGTRSSGDTSTTADSFYRIYPSLSHTNYYETDKKEIISDIVKALSESYDISKEAITFKNTETDNHGISEPKTDGTTGVASLLLSPNVSETKMMTLKFYPQGVLLNVHLNHINELPPKILYEVDKMLKRYMSNGDIDLALLERQLNTTMLNASETDLENPANLNLSQIDHMLDIIENLLNSSDKSENNYEPSTTNVPNHFADPELKSENNYERSTTNVPNHFADPELIMTNNFSNLYKNAQEYENINTSAIVRATDQQLSSEVHVDKPADTNDLPNVTQQNSQTAEKIQIHISENERPFVRRRLFRKYRYPSIREQLQRQNYKQHHYNDSKHLSSANGENPEPERIVDYKSNRHRYPSLTEQLIRQNFHYNNSTSTNSHVLEENGFQDDKKDGSLPKNFEFGTRLRTTEYDDSFQHQVRNRYWIPQYLNEFPGRNLRQTNTENTNSPELIVPFHPNYKVDFDDEKDSKIQSRIPLHGYDYTIDNNSTTNVRNSLDYSRFRYTLPLPSYLPTEIPVTTLHDTKSLVANSFYSENDSFFGTEHFDLHTQKTSVNTEQPRRKRKLRVLVRKSNANVNPNVPTQNQDDKIASTNHKLPEGFSDNVLKTLRTRLSKKLNVDSERDVKIQVQFEDHVWNIPFVNNQSELSISPIICTRSGLFQHPKDCNMFYECFWDKWVQKYTLHVFSCPVRLVYDDRIRGCSRPNAESRCNNFVKR
ncbi:hypothetical protein X975_07271, partial [Stegodyphus mimosarum]